MIDLMALTVLGMSWFIAGFIGYQIGIFVSKQEEVKDE